MNSYLKAVAMILLAGIALCDDRRNAPTTPHGNNQGQPSLVQIKGEVYDQAKKPLAGVSILMEPLDGYPAMNATATTDSQGRYVKMVKRTNGNYRLTASKKGYEFIPSSQEVRGAGGSANFKGVFAK